MMNKGTKMKTQLYYPVNHNDRPLTKGPVTLEAAYAEGKFYEAQTGNPFSLVMAEKVGS